MLPARSGGVFLFLNFLFSQQAGRLRKSLGLAGFIFLERESFLSLGKVYFPRGGLKNSPKDAVLGTYFWDKIGLAARPQLSPAGRYRQA